MAGHDLPHVGIPAPPGFPREPYEKILAHLRAKRAGWAEPTLFDAWDAVAYRFRSCVDHHARFGKLAEGASGRSLDPERVRQLQEALFGFLVYGSAVVDSFCYGVYAVGSHTVTPGFSLTTSDARRAATPDATLARLAALGRHLRLTQVLDGVLSCGEYKRWVRNRDELARRAAAPRVKRAADGSGRAAWRWPKFDSGDVIWVDPASTRSRLDWLTTSLRGLLEAAEEFTRERLGRADSPDP
jgi:hypothetical protein